VRSPPAFHVSPIPARPAASRAQIRAQSGFVNWGFRSSNGCALRTLRPVGSSRHRRPTLRGAGQAPRVKVERPAGRTTWTRGAWSARLCLDRWSRVNRIPASATQELCRFFPVHPGARGPRRRHKNFTAALQVQVAVYLAAMADSSNGDYPGLIVHDVDDAVITHPHSQPG